MLDGTNPYKVRNEVEDCTYIRGEVAGFSVDTESVKITVPELPDNIYIYAYLPLNQLEDLEIGQKVTIRGRFAYQNYSSGSSYIHIGNAAGWIWFTVKARIIE